ncbi:hypothetical protein Tco_0470807 [Tanacetum coccineum]
MDITVVTLVGEQMSPWKGNLPRLPIKSNIVRLATTSIVALEVSRLVELIHGNYKGEYHKLGECTLPTQGMRSIISMVSISPEGFLPSILLLVVIIVTVVIVTVILVVVVVAIVGVVIVVAIIGNRALVSGPLVCELCWWLLPESEVLKQ